MREPNPQLEYLTTAQVAKICGVNRATVVRWIQNGNLIAERTIGGRYRIQTAGLLAQADEKGIFIATEQRKQLEKALVKTGKSASENSETIDQKSSTIPLILVIDDDLYVRKLLEEFLTVMGYNVLVADNGFKGLDIILKNYTVKLVILDLLMPGIDGTETLRRIRDMRSDVPVIVTSGYVEHYFPGGVDTIGSKVEKVLNKPFDLDELAAVCKELLEAS